MKSTFNHLPNYLSVTLKSVALAFLLACTSSNLQAQWQAYTPQLADTVGAFDLRIATGDQQVAWCVAMKYIVSPTTYEWLPMDNLVFAKTSDGGNTWSGGTIPMGPEPYASNICPVTNNTAWASGTDLDYVSYVLRTDDGGVTWTRQLEDGFAGASSYVDFVHFWDAQNGLAVGDPAESDTDPNPFYEIYTTTDGGANWDRVPSANIPAPAGDFGSSALYQAKGDYVWFGTIDATTFAGKRLYRSKDRGQHWEVLNNANEIFGFFSFADTLHGIATRRVSATEVELRYTASSGDTWTKLPSLTGPDFTTSIVLIPGSNYILATRRPDNIAGPFRTILSKDLGQSWIELGTSEHVATLQFSSPTVGYGGEWQSADHATRMYKYAGSPLTGLFSGQELQASVAVSPNPTSDWVQVKIDVPEPTAFIVLLNNAQGQLVERKSIEKTAQGNAKFDLSSLPAGIYALTVSSDKGSTTHLISRQ